MPKPFAMLDQEYDRIQDLLREYDPVNTLEIGMANGFSSAAFCAHHQSNDKGSHMAIDPFQSDADHFNNQGVELVKSKGLESYFSLIEDFSDLALPQLLKEKRTFDMILIDGWHSYQSTFIDMYYSDKLLKSNGVLLIHDTYWASVYYCCRFLEMNMNYKRLSPLLDKRADTAMGKNWSRLKTILKGPTAIKDRKTRSSQWLSLSAYEKLGESNHSESDYKHFG